MTTSPAAKIQTLSKVLAARLVDRTRSGPAANVGCCRTRLTRWVQIWGIKRAWRKQDLEILDDWPWSTSDAVRRSIFGGRPARQLTKVAMAGQQAVP
mmetsp:Transcript_41444/g.96804  ORF Transcript_41444/g.96804 Transcript_41444/m.96804 type:complete len:97 (+) Transcript_41444:1003-1293(+)